MQLQSRTIECQHAPIYQGTNQKNEISQCLKKLQAPKKCMKIYGIEERRFFIGSFDSLRVGGKGLSAVSSWADEMSSMFVTGCLNKEENRQTEKSVTHRVHYKRNIGNRTCFESCMYMHHLKKPSEKHCLNRTIQTMLIMIIGEETRALIILFLMKKPK